VDDVFASAELFIRCNARLLEQRVFATVFRGAPALGVVNAVRAYQNEDGGLGHALEPDTRCPVSLPVYVETGLQALSMAGAVDVPLVTAACDFLERAADDAGAGGAVALASPRIEDYPRAEHWTDWTYEPGLNPTAGLVGLLYDLDVDHPWRAAGTEYCWRQLEEAPLPDDAHALSEVLLFLGHVPERERATEHAERVTAHLRGLPMFHLDPDTPGYGLSPLFIAPLSTSPWRHLFTDAEMGAHLAHLVKTQQDDGGWPIAWEPPSPAAALEWRGLVTLQAMRSLVSYGRAPVPRPEQDDVGRSR
jgi:hypothetical protein